MAVWLLPAGSNALQPAAKYLTFYLVLTVISVYMPQLKKSNTGILSCS